tara:strand:- start:407 stop:913 length:507 start_codon:yes stop_codon:yes gene_type:complete
MVLKFQKWYKLLNVIFEHPNEEFTVRKLSKLTKIPNTSIQRYLNLLKKEEIINKENKAQQNSYVKFLKSFYFIDKLHQVGLIDHLEKELIPSTIVLFGSIRKGEYDKDSDIDIFIESTKKQKLNLSHYEKLLNHKIQVFIEKDIKDLPPRLLNNVINGIKLRGYIKIK